MRARSEDEPVVRQLPALLDHHDPPLVVDALDARAMPFGVEFSRDVPKPHAVHIPDARRLIHVHRAIEELHSGSDDRDVDAVPGHRP